MSQVESTKKLTQQDKERAERKRKLVSDSFNKMQLHSSDAASQCLQKEADSQLKGEMQAAEQYISLQTGSRTWFVLCRVNCKIGSSAVPENERVPTLSIDDDNGMVCSCGSESHFGIPD
jgi:hypothetical protein